jgi:hypothetical protein
MLLSALGTGMIGMLAACAHSVPVEGAPAASSNVQATGSTRWTANIQSVTQNRGQVQQTTRDRSYGSANWTIGESPTLSRFDLVFTYTGEEKFLSWAILPGACGTGALPILPMANFPEINVGGGGRGQVSGSLPMVLPTSGAYHIDIYRDRRPSVDNLVACGNMKYSG